MNERISALIDGELDDEAVLQVCMRMRSESASRQCCSEYQLIGDALRKSGHLDQDVSARVMKALHDEPVVLAPRPVRARPLLQNALALAASVAGVVVVMSMVWSGTGISDASVAVAPAAQVPPALRDPNMQAYLVAHQTQAPSTTMHGATHYLKTVSLETDAGAKQ